MGTHLPGQSGEVAGVDPDRAERGTGLKQLVNQALRQGLRELEGTPRPSGQRYRTAGVDLGRCRLASLDDVAAALAAGEGEGFQ